jgi:hypothetical protein
LDAIYNVRCNITLYEKRKWRIFMNQDVLIKVCGLQIVEETGDNVEVLAQGKHYVKKDKHYILYDEIEDESDLKTSNIIKFNEDVVEIIRKGSMGGKLVFQENTRNQSLYSTPMGDMFIEILTENITVNESEDDVNLKVKYQIYIDGNKISDNEITINARNR